MRSKVSGREVGAVKVCVLSSKEETREPWQAWLPSAGEGSQGWKHGWSQDVSQEPVLEENGEPKLFGDVEAWEPPP